MRPWQQFVQKIIFALLFTNTCLLLAVVASPFFDYPPLFSAESAPLLDMEIPVQQESGLLFGNMRLQTVGGLSLPAARLLINNNPAGNFGEGSLTVRVYEGDLLSIDGSAYKKRLEFTLNAVSSNIDSARLPASIFTEDSTATLPPISFK